MTTIKFEELPEAVKRNKITKEEAIKRLWEEMYKFPRKFGLGEFTEDQKSDFLLGMSKIFGKIFDKYTPGQVSFRAYISGCVKTYKMSFLRLQKSAALARKSLAPFLYEKLEEEKFNNQIKLSDSIFDKQKQNKSFSDIAKKKTSGAKEKTKRITELTALVLMMKACKDIDDDTIESVSGFTGIEKSILYEKIQELKNGIEKKEKNNQKLVRRRNNAYYFHRKYMHEMLTASKNDLIIEDIEKRYKLQTKKWEENNKRLSVKSVSPSNEEVARIIGLKPRTVSFYINHVRKAENQIRMREIIKEESQIQNEGQNAVGEEEIL